MKKIYFILPLVAFLFSCEKIIDLDLNSTSSAVVIEGTINDQPGPYQVKLTRTVNYDAVAENTLNNGLLIMSDDLGFIDTLILIGEGIYQTQSIQGSVGRTYTLSVTVDGENYTQSSTLNDFIAIDSVVWENSINPFSQEPIILITNYFTDPSTVNDYYRTYFFVRHKEDLSGYSDFKLTNDPESDDPVQLQTRFREELESGDTIDVQLRHIDQATYEYYSTLSDLIDAGFAPSGIPDNPNSSWTNGGLGYFSAYSVDYEQVVLP